ncbi:E3 ubiquitin-protein ligase TRIM71 [Nematostella vectensis]|uniref:E3 ubiquitin-protein ligase TRIM71 n=1 Tax=Nematostella vectensis TaxID=45351 RepID=UPI001390667A|nr:E3 ubiquitin-protein ligase TRIM71 [Nematostella vectensis]
MSQTALDKFETLKAREKSLANIINDLKSTLNQLGKNAENAKKEVAKEADKLISCINASKKELQSRITTLKDELAKDMNKEKAEFEKRLKETKKVREDAAKYMNSPDSKLHEEIVRKICDDFINNAAKNCPSKYDPSIRFIESTEAAKLKEGKIGVVQIIKPTDPWKCSLVLNKEYKTEAGAIAKLNLFTYTAAGEPSIAPGSVIDTLVTPSTRVTDVRVKEGPAEGLSEVEFLPLISGEFNVDVLVHGLHVSGSPMKVKVLPREMRVVSEFIMKWGNTPPLRSLSGIAVNKKFTLVAITDDKQHCVAVFDRNGALLNIIGHEGGKRGCFNDPDGIAFLDEFIIVVADKNNHRMQVFDTRTGKVLNQFGKRGKKKGAFMSPLGVHVDDKGQIVVSDTYNGRIQVFNSKAELVEVIDLAQVVPDCLPSRTVTHSDLVVVADSRMPGVTLFNKKDQAKLEIGRSRSGPDDATVNSIAIDGNKNLVVCSNSLSCVQMYTLEGFIVARFNDKRFKAQDVAALPDGQIMVIERRSARIFVIE